MTKINFTEEQTEYIVNSYLKGVSRNQLRKELGVSDNPIKRVLKENNIALRGIQETNTKRKFNINDHYFDTESPNMAYIMGFWAADGNVHSKQNRLDLELASLDFEILEKIREELDCERPVKIYQCQSGYIKNKLFFWSSGIKKKFAEYGIVPNKTYSPDFHAPYKLNEKYWIDYIRGFFDGDGSVTKNSSIRFSLVSVNLKFLEDLQNFLLNYYGIKTQVNLSHGPDIPNGKNLWSLYCYGDWARKIYEVLYTPNSLFLQRKKDKWEELL